MSAARPDPSSHGRDARAQLVLGPLGAGHSEMLGIIERENAMRAAELASALAAHRLAGLTIAYLESGRAMLRPSEWGETDPRHELYETAKAVLASAPRQP